MNLAVIQMVSQDDVQTNLRLARRMLERAAQGGAPVSYTHLDVYKRQFLIR